MWQQLEAIIMLHAAFLEYISINNVELLFTLQSRGRRPNWNSLHRFNIFFKQNFIILLRRSSWILMLLYLRSSKNSGLLIFLSQSYSNMEKNLVKAEIHTCDFVGRLDRKCFLKYLKWLAFKGVKEIHYF